MSATMMVAARPQDVDPKVWTPNHIAIIKAAAEDPQVERIFVNAGDQEGAVPRAPARIARWLRQGAPVVGARLSFPCAHGLPGRRARTASRRTPAPARRRLRQGTGLVVQGGGAAPEAVAETGEAAPPIKMADLPAACRQVLMAP